VADSFSRLSGSRPSVEETRTNYDAGGLYQFPSDIGKYWIALSFTEYNYFANDAIKRKPGASIILPVPINLEDQNALEYSNISPTSELSNAVKSAATTGLKFAAGVSAAAGKILEGSEELLVANVLNPVLKTAGVATGLAINTHQSLMFVQPTMKIHNFQWKLIPSTPEESAKISAIINVIKKHIYPRTNFATFKYPDLINVYLSNADKMYLFKPAFVDSFSVNYTNESGPAFYNTSYPVAVTITMRIRENTVWTSDEFAASPNSLRGGRYSSVFPNSGPASYNTTQPLP
jgi:hypothetical protein